MIGWERDRAGNSIKVDGMGLRLRLLAVGAGKS